MFNIVSGANASKISSTLPSSSLLFCCESCIEKRKWKWWSSFFRRCVCCLGFEGKFFHHLLLLFSLFLLSSTSHFIFFYFFHSIFQEWTTVRVYVLSFTLYFSSSSSNSREGEWMKEIFSFENINDMRNVCIRDESMNPIWTIIDLLSWLIQHITASAVIIGNCRTMRVQTLKKNKNSKKCSTVFFDCQLLHNTYHTLVTHKNE